MISLGDCAVLLLQMISTSTHPDERVLGVSNGGEGTEVEDEDKLGAVRGQLDGGLAEGWVLYMGAGRGQAQRCQEAIEGTAHLPKHKLVGCLQDWDVLQAQQRLVHTEGS